MLMKDKTFGDTFWVTKEGTSCALHYEDVKRLALGASWEGELEEQSQEFMERLLPLTEEQIDDLLVRQNATDFERILAQFIHCVRQQVEPCCYGRATNTSVVGFIEDIENEEKVNIEIYTREGGKKATFRAMYNQNVFDPYHPYWDIFQKVGEGEYYDEESWEYKGIVDDKTGKFFEERSCTCGSGVPWQFCQANSPYCG